MWNPSGLDSVTPSPLLCALEKANRAGTASLLGFSSMYVFKVLFGYILRILFWLCTKGQLFSLKQALCFIA